MKLGVCYYPEQWPETFWADDAQRMRALGLSFVRIGEFAWSRIEPEDGRYDWAWLDRAVAVLAAAGLEIVMGTPTATPPKWLIDKHPEILARGRDGNLRGFGSRRHYCFSSPVFAQMAARICEAVARRYGRHPAVTTWQTDNEYGCHDTVVSTSHAAQAGFRHWLAARYGSVAALNEAWGLAFWSQDYNDFAQIDAPFGTVTEAHPAHRLDWQRFASDEVVRFNRMQADIIREHSPGRDILHNFMGLFTDFDHHAVAADLDIAAWDSYPLGFLNQGPFTPAEKTKYLRTGHPDLAAFHHDLYRGVGRGRWWVIEQQPGPVNWAAWNPAPAAGAVRMWTWEAFAHGAEKLAYFRWRQAPTGQEAMHAGLLRPDSVEAAGAVEAAQVAAELAHIERIPDTVPASVALLFDYQSIWGTQVQPQGRDYDGLAAAMLWHGALRQLGLDVDIVPPGADLAGYRLVVMPCLLVIDSVLAATLEASGAKLLAGPRAGSKTRDFAIPAALPPDGLQRLIDLRVTRVESLPPGIIEAADDGIGHVTRWLEDIETTADIRLKLADGRGVWFGNAKIDYIAGWADPVLLDRVMRGVVAAAGLPIEDWPEHVRVRRRGSLRFAFNYGDTPIDLGDFPHLAGILPALPDIVVGSLMLPPAGVIGWLAKNPPEIADLAL